MADVKRTPDEIRQEYFRTCTALGDLTYQLEIGIPKTVADLKSKLENLNLEHAAAIAAQTTESKNG